MMDVNELIQELKDIYCDFLIPNDEHIYWHQKDAIHEVIEKLEKQVPKKPLSEGGVIRRGGEPVFTIPDRQCPNCNVLLAYINVNYCPNCGQRLDWSK